MRKSKRKDIVEGFQLCAHFFVLPVLAEFDGLLGEVGVVVADKGRRLPRARVVHHLPVVQRRRDVLTIRKIAHAKSM